MTERTHEYFAFIGADGRIGIDSHIQTEDAVWDVFLGWPAKEEIKWHKWQGARVVKVKVIVPDA